FQVNTTENTDNNYDDDYDADYPGNFGYNHDVFVFTLNMFNNSSSGTFHVQVDAIDLAALTATKPSLKINHQDIVDASLRPTVMHDSVAGDPMWLLSETGYLAPDGEHLNVVRMSNPDNPKTTFFSTFQVAVNSYAQAVPPMQPDGSQITDLLDSRILK